MKNRKPQRASLRIAKKTIEKKLNTYSSRKKREVKSLLSKNKIWSAVRKLYVPSNTNVSSREGVSRYFYPLPQPYNASRNTITRNKRNVNRSLNTVSKNYTLLNIVVPLVGAGAKGAGVSSNYISTAKNTANMKYATIGGNRKLKAFALLQNTSPNSRYINVIGAFPGYGSSLMNRIISNAKSNGKKYVNLSAVTNRENNKNANSYPLVKWYKSKGFERSGTLSNYLLPMRHTIR